GWGITDTPAGTVISMGKNPNGGGHTGGAAPLDGGSGARRRYHRAQEEGRWMMDRRQNGAPVVNLSEQPCPTVTSAMFGKGVARVWWEERPSTTLVGSFSPHMVAPPGHREFKDVSRQDAEGAVRITVDEAAILQGFARPYPWQGTKSKQFEQVGNVV